MMEYFPHERLRPGQRNFIELVRRAVEEGKSAVIEAPTGFGKTAAVLAGVLPTAIDGGFKVVYLARTHRQMDRVIEELRNVEGVSAVEFRSRSNFCLHEYLTRYTTDAYNAMIVCKNLRKLGKCKFYEREKRKRDEFEALIAELSKCSLLPPELIHLARDYGFCPYDITKRLAEKSNVIVASYLYFLVSSIRRAFLDSLGIDYSDIIVIFDEAHNLPDQAISALSDKLSVHSIERAISEAEDYGENEIASFLAILLQGIVELYDDRLNGRDVSEVPIRPEPIFGRVMDVLGFGWREIMGIVNEMTSVGDFIREDRIEKGRPPRSYVGRVASFLAEWLGTLGAEDYLHLMTKESRLSLELVALDPSVALEWVGNVKSSIFMSGTLSPLSAFTAIMGIKEPLTKSFPRMVKPENVSVLVAKDVSTRGSERSLEGYKKIARYILTAVSSIPKNVGVFAASYEVLEGLLSVNLPSLLEETGKKVFIERRGLDSNENDILIKNFKESSKGNGGVLLGVMGGRNSEGQDYRGDEMKGVVLVGIPYARPTPRTEARIRYFERKFPGKGRYYGYYLPAHRKLVQAAGRVHRSAEEKGSIVILDYRVLWKSVRKDFPKWLRDTMRPVTLRTLNLNLRRFWNRNL